MVRNPDYASELDDHAGLAAWVDDDGTFHAAPEYQGSFRVSPALFIGSLPVPGAHVRTDPRAIQRVWDEEDAAQRRQRRLQRVAVGRATGLTPDQVRRGGAILHHLIVAAGVILLFWMALGIIAAAFGGRL
jgi:hypothetical protein